MSPEKINQAIGEFCGWKPETRKMYAGENNVKGWGKNQHLDLGHRDREFITGHYGFENYHEDLNAIHGAVTKLIYSKRKRYRQWLQTIMSRGLKGGFVIAVEECIDATAQQRCEALLRTIGKWEESQPTTPTIDAAEEVKI
jgi:hypothetical protein